MQVATPSDYMRNNASKASSKSGATRDAPLRYRIRSSLYFCCVLLDATSCSSRLVSKPVARDPKYCIATIAIQRDFRLPSSASQNFNVWIAWVEHF